ncbi:MAG TPA: polysaccharide deacetylase family protein [Casimicrobiaceae bacterium]|nr:polysaccharide deacetylase family protein [Casimicrobiaceae bacterium]
MSRNDGVIVLMYHRVGLARNAWEGRYAISPGRFEAHMLALARNGLHAVSVESLSDWLDGGAPLATGAFVLTFDDGFRDVRLHALPVLERLRWPFTVFLVSSLIGKEDFWTRASNPDGATYPLLNAEEILDMQRRGVSCQSHSSSHPSLPSLDDDRLASELVESRAALRQMLGQPVDYFAYPYGHLDERVVAATRSAGYRAAFSTQPGFNRRGADRFRIRRIDVYGTDTPGMLMRKVRLGSNDGSVSSLARYYLARARARLSLPLR